MKLIILSIGQDERILAETLLIVGNGKEHTTNEKVSFLGVIVLYDTTLHFHLDEAFTEWLQG